MKNRKILLGLTTMSGSNWKEKISEINKFNIKEIALFPTCLKKEDRKELYELLSQTGLNSIPQVHLRDDMEMWEIEYLRSKYNTKVFNIHPGEKFIKFIKLNKGYNNCIFIENLNIITDTFEADVKKCGGICLDLSHYYDYGILQKSKGYYANFEALANKYTIGCNHISAVGEAVKDLGSETNEPIRSFNHHYLKNLNEVDYIKKIPRKYFADYISIELENSFEQQLKVKERLEKIINNN